MERIQQQILSIQSRLDSEELPKDRARALLWRKIKYQDELQRLRQKREGKEAKRQEKSDKKRNTRNQRAYNNNWRDNRAALNSSSMGAGTGICGMGGMGGKGMGYGMGMGSVHPVGGMAAVGNMGGMGMGMGMGMGTTTTDNNPTNINMTGSFGNPGMAMRAQGWSRPINSDTNNAVGGSSPTFLAAVGPGTLHSPITPASVQAANVMMYKMKLENLKYQLPGLENAVSAAEQQIDKCRTAVQIAYCSGDSSQEERAKQALAQAKQGLVTQRAQIQAWKAQRKDLKQALKSCEKERK